MMRSTICWTLPVAILLATLAGSANAVVIGIDGQNDWAAQTTFDNQDAIGDNAPAGYPEASSWGIDKNWDIFSPARWGDGLSQGSGTASNYNFMVQMVGSFPLLPDVDNKMRIMLNTDRNDATGKTSNNGLRGYLGTDYYIGFTPSLLPDGVSTTTDLWKWNPGDTYTSVGQVVVARTGLRDPQGYWIAEVSVDPTLIWGAAKPDDIYWGAYLTPDSTPPSQPIFTWPNDHCQGVDGATVENTGPFPWKVAAVPEPGTMALFGFGLMGLMAIRRRKVEA